MEPPRDGETDASADGTLAKIIPLRRRGMGGEDLEFVPNETPDADVFEAPPDPEPLEGYSVWERPTAELIRRPLLPEPVVRRRVRACASVLAHERWRVALAAQVLILAVLVALALGRGATHHASSSRNEQSAMLGLGVAGPGVESSRARAPEKVKRGGARVASGRPHHSARQAPHSRRAAGESTASSSSEVAQTTYADAASPSASSSAPAASTPSRRASETASAHAASSASREFGFEN